MQAALITFMQKASNSVEPSAEAAASSHGLRIDAALPSQKANTLFTSILQQGIAENVPLNPALGLGEASPLIVGVDSTVQTSEEASVDVCSLLMQLMVMNAAVPADGGHNGGSAKPEGQTVQGILGAINENPDATTAAVHKGLDHAAAVILQNDGNAAEVLQALAMSKSAAAGNNGQPLSDTAAAQLDAALSGMTEALNKALEQNAAVSDAAEGAAAAVSVIENDTVQNVAKSDDAEATGRTAALFRAGAAATDETAENAAAGIAKAGERDERSFDGSRDSGKNNDMRMAANGATPVPSQAGAEGEITAEKTFAVERALTSFTDDLTSFQGGSKEIRIILEPEKLGVLVISVIKTESGISAKIKSEDKEVAAIISGQLQKLIASMESKGLKVDNVDVAYPQMEQNTGFAQQDFSQARDEASRGFTRPAPERTEGDTPEAGFWQSYQSSAASADTAVDYRI